MRPPERPPSGADDANKVWYLRRNRLFGEATEAGVVSNEHLFTMCEMPRGTRVFDHGDTTRIVYWSSAARCASRARPADGKDVTVALLGAGDFFGEETLFDDRAAHDGRRRRRGRAAVHRARRRSVRAALARSGARAQRRQVLSERLDDARATMEDLAYARVGDRIVHLYRKLAAEHGVPVAGGTRVDMRLTHADVASLVGSTRETVSAEIAKLVEPAACASTAAPSSSRRRTPRDRRGAARRRDVARARPRRGAWANAPGPPPTAGRVTIVDVFTFDCINCKHVTPELHKLRARTARAISRSSACTRPSSPKSTFTRTSCARCASKTSPGRSSTTTASSSGTRTASGVADPARLRPPRHAARDLRRRGLRRAARTHGPRAPRGAHVTAAAARHSRVLRTRRPARLPAHRRGAHRRTGCGRSRSSCWS